MLFVLKKNTEYASPVILKGSFIEKNYVPVLTGKGATGFGTGLLLSFIENLSKEK